MTSRPSRRFVASWWWLALASVSALLLVAATVTVAVSSVPVTPNLNILAAAAFPVVGAVVVIRRPGNRVGQLLVAAGAWYSLGAAATTYAWLGLEGYALPLADLSAWLALWAYWPLSFLIPFLISVFPSGRVASGWLRRLLQVGVVVAVALVATLMVLPVPVNSILLGEGLVNPWGVQVLAPLAPVDEALPYAALALLVPAVVDLVLRWRRSRGVERLQMRWAGLGLSVAVVLFVIALVSDMVGLATNLPWVAAWGLGFGALPVAVGLAVARYRLYEIDRLVSRTVSYALVVGALVAVYTGGVFLLGGLLPLEGDLAVAASTLVVAALFNPLRRRVQLRVDRRFNRSRYDAAREVDRFAAGLTDRVEFDQITAELSAVVHRTVQPERVGLWIRSRP